MAVRPRQESPRGKANSLEGGVLLDILLPEGLVRVDSADFSQNFKFKALIAHGGGDHRFLLWPPKKKRWSQKKKKEV